MRRSARALDALLWAGLGTGGQAAFQVLATVVLARLLTPADFGLVGAALVVIGLSVVVSPAGIGSVVVQRPELGARFVRTAFTVSVIAGAAFTCLTMIAAPLLALLFREPDLARVMRAMSWIFLLQAAGVVGESLLQRELSFRRLAAIDVASFVVGFGLVGIAGAWRGHGVSALVAAHVAHNGLRSCLLLVWVPHPKRPLLDRAACAELLRVGGGFSLGRLGLHIALQGDSFAVERWLGTAALGIYGRARQMTVTPSSIFGFVLDRVLFPTMSQLRQRRGDLGLAYRRGLASTALVALPASALVVAVAPDLVRALLGPGWDEAAAPTRVLAAGTFFWTGTRVGDSVVRAAAAVYRRAWRQGLHAALVMGLALWGKRWGVVGVAAGVLVAGALSFALTTHLAMQLSSLSWRDLATAHGPGLALAAVAGALTTACATLLRACSAPALLVALALPLGGLLAGVVAHAVPSVFLGQDGRWLVRQLAATLRRTEPAG